MTPCQKWNQFESQRLYSTHRILITVDLNFPLVSSYFCKYYRFISVGKLNFHAFDIAALRILHIVNYA